MKVNPCAGNGGLPYLPFRSPPDESFRHSLSISDWRRWHMF